MDKVLYCCFERAKDSSEDAEVIVHKEETNEPSGDEGAVVNNEATNEATSSAHTNGSHDENGVDIMMTHLEYISKLETENDELNQEADKWTDLSQQLGTCIDHRGEKIEDLTQRLSKEMSTKVSSNESAVENVSIKNRPMNVSEEYQLLCSNIWLDAKTVLDDYADDTENMPAKLQKLTLLCDTFEISERIMTNCFKAWMHKLTALMSNPLAQSDAENPDIKGKRALGKSVCNVTGDDLRQTADHVDCTGAVKDVVATLDEKYGASPDHLWTQSKDAEQIQDFIQQVVRLTWKMAIQRPPMRFDFKPQWLGERFQDMYWDSEPGDNCTVHVVYPMLYHGESLMAKGKVLLVHQDKSSHQTDDVKDDVHLEIEVEGEDIPSES